jgi:glycosyltransferase involved in cell wall biosynthesis
MRIVMLAQFFPPIIGGEERHVQTLSRALVARGHEVAVVTLWHAGMTPYEEDAGVRIYRVRALTQRLPGLFSEGGRRHAPPWPDPETTRALSAILARERPQIVHAHNWLVHAFLPLKRRDGPKLVLTLHDYGLVCAKKNLMLDEDPCAGPAPMKCARCALNHYGALKGLPTVTASRLMRAIEQRTVDCFLPVSTAVAEGNQLARHHLPYQVIPNFVPDDVGERVVAADDPLLAPLPAEPFLLYVGDRSRQKGVEVLLRAYAELRDAPPLVLIGRPFPNVAATLPPNVLALPALPHAAIMAAWHRSLLGIVPSIWPDPCPTVAMEAMAMGRALVATRIGGLPDIVAEGATGLLIPPNDPAALQTALTDLLAQPALRDQMGAAARQRVATFQARTVIPQIEAAYNELLGIKKDGASMI